jgi:large subunit ribosomal protein L4
MATTKTTTKTATRASAKKPAAPASALEAKIFAMDGKEQGTIALPAEIFNADWNADLVHQVVVGMQANARQSIAHTKFRGEVSGGGKKPWKQKGTGRARHGSTRSPIWRGGGITHGPRAEKDYSVKINKKMRLAALKSVLSRKWADGEVIFVDSFSFAAPKTKEAKGALVAIAKATGQEQLATKRKNAAVFAFATKDSAAEKSFRNIGSVMTEEVRNLNPVDLMNKKYLVIASPQESLQVLSSRLGS